MKTDKAESHPEVNRGGQLTFRAAMTVSWCFFTASWENSEAASRHILSRARYLQQQDSVSIRHLLYCHGYYYDDRTDNQPRM